MRELPCGTERSSCAENTWHAPHCHWPNHRATRMNFFSHLTHDTIQGVTEKALGTRGLDAHACCWRPTFFAVPHFAPKG